MERALKPAMKFNLVIYREGGRKLAKPKFIANVYIQSSVNKDSEVYAYDADVFDAMGEDPTIALMHEALSVSHKYCGIWIEGVEWRPVEGDVIRDWQTWLITTLTEEQLAKEDFYRG